MLKEHLKRTARLSKPKPGPSKKKGNPRIVYLFVCIVLAILVSLVLVTYDFSIHQPSIDQSALSQFDSAIVVDSDSGASDLSPPDGAPSDNVQTRKIEKWPLETTNGPHCEGVFGNGYRDEMLSCSTDRSSFKCMQNPFSHQMYCEAVNLILNPSMISISDGGEDIAAVSGRKEDMEFPRFEHDPQSGATAFNVDCEPQGAVPKKNGVSYYMADIVDFLRSAGVGNTQSVYHSKYLSDYGELCQGTGDEAEQRVAIFLLTMRYEYANMYHQATDWYNFYQVIHALDIGHRYDIILLDGHAASQIDDAWRLGLNEAEHRFVKQLNGGKALCLKRAIFVSAGYVGGISLKTHLQSKCREDSHYVRAFGPWFLKGFGIETRTERARRSLTITLVCRRDYVAHPRNMVGKATRKFHDDAEVAGKIQTVLGEIGDSGWNYTVNAVAWSELTFREQLQVAATTDILIGAHGAGLSHVLFLPPHSALVEIKPNGFGGEPHFQAFAQWLGIPYGVVPGGAAQRVDPQVKELRQVLQRHLEYIKLHV